MAERPEFLNPLASGKGGATMETVSHDCPQVNSFTIILDVLGLQYQILAELEDHDISLVEDWSDFNLDDVLSVIKPEYYGVPSEAERLLKCHHCYPGIDDASLPEEIEPLFIRYKQSFLESKDLPEFKSITGMVFYKKTVTSPTLKIKDIEQIHLVGLLSMSASAPDQDTPGQAPLNYSPWSGKVYSDAPGATPKKTQPPLRIVPKKKPSADSKDRHDKAPQDVLKYFAYLKNKHQFIKVLLIMYKLSIRIDLRKLSHYRGHHSKKARVYLLGHDVLVERTALSDRSVKRAIRLMKDDCIIKHRGGGLKGQGNAILEVPFDLAHVFAWRRKPRKSKTYLL